MLTPSCLGHLDRVVQGSAAEDILSACEERSDVSSAQVSNASNPSISIGQALKRANMATFRNFAQQQLQKAQDVLQTPDSTQQMMHHPSLVSVTSSTPLMLQSLKMNARDCVSHVAFVDVEALIGSVIDFHQMSNI